MRMSTVSLIILLAANTTLLHAEDNQASREQHKELEACLLSQECLTTLITATPARAKAEMFIAYFRELKQMNAKLDQMLAPSVFSHDETRRSDKESWFPE